jgi:hypothetical protein
MDVLFDLLMVLFGGWGEGYGDVGACDGGVFPPPKPR